MKRILYVVFALFAVLAVLVLVVNRLQRDREHGHAPGTVPAAEAVSRAVTQWTDSMELFMEYPVPVAGRAGRFIIHLTILDGFQPVREGAVTLGFRGPDGIRREVVSDELLREGIFTPTVSLPQAGAYEFDLDYRGPGAAETFRIRDFIVHAVTGDFPATADEEAADGIAFLKEQQWKIPFATTTAAVREIKRSVRAIGEVLPSPAAYVEIVAPVDGIVLAGEAGGLALPGARIARGAVVARIAPPLQGDSWAATRLALAQAERDLARADRLRGQDAISVREFEEAQNAYQVLEVGHQRLAGGGADGVLSLTAPISGQVIDWRISPGQLLRTGDKLMAITDPGTVWLRVNVYENDYRSLGKPVGAFVHAGGEDGGWEIPESGMRVLSSGGTLDPATRTIPVLLEVANGEGRLTINESTPVELYGSDGAMATAVPRSAVFEDEGLDVVFVQEGGESFTKRFVTLGPHHAGWVSVLDGVRSGERVVTRGGYHVKLASTSTEIGHGHAH